MILNNCNRISRANNRLLQKQVLSSKGLSPHALQAIRFSRVYGAVFEYSVFDSQPTRSNLDCCGADCVEYLLQLFRFSELPGMFDYFRFARDSPRESRRRTE